MTGENELAQIREATEAVLEKARNDETYCAALLADPVGTLVAAGVPQAEATDITVLEFREDDADTGGYMRAGGCDGITCFTTNCSNIPRTGKDGCPTWSAAI
jgi:hypothetical protein